MRNIYSNYLNKSAVIGLGSESINAANNTRKDTYNAAENLDLNNPTGIGKNVTNNITNNYNQGGGSSTPSVADQANQQVKSLTTAPNSAYAPQSNELATKGLDLAGTAFNKLFDKSLEMTEWMQANPEKTSQDYIKFKGEEILNKVKNRPSVKNLSNTVNQVIEQVGNKGQEVAQTVGDAYNNMQTQNKMFKNLTNNGWVNSETGAITPGTGLANLGKSWGKDFLSSAKAFRHPLAR